MPRLWNDTMSAHRRAVTDATLDATARLVAERGLHGVSMSEIAKQTGIGRATLYKYFPDLDAILLAWHGRHISAHLEMLVGLRDSAADPEAGLRAVLSGYAMIVHHRGRHGGEIAAMLHRKEHVAAAERQVVDLIRDLIVAAGSGGRLRTDAPADELARYCFHALEAAGSLPSKAAVDRLLAVIWRGLKA